MITDFRVGDDLNTLPLFINASLGELTVSSNSSDLRLGRGPFDSRLRLRFSTSKKDKQENIDA